MELLPPISADLGAMVSLQGKLDALQLDVELKHEMKKLTTRLLELSKLRDPPVTVKIWMNDVRELSYLMDNCVDAGEDWIDQMPDMKARLKEVNGRYDRYIPESISNPTGIVPIADHRIQMVDGGRKKADLVVGLHDTDGPVDRVSQLLIDEDTKLKVVSIIGAGGIGKTTLVKQLWRGNELGEFQCRAFVRTAKKPDMRRILRSILAQVRPHKPPDANEVHELIQDIKEHLQDKRYFIVIDDMWDTSVWDVASRAFPEGGKGSRIITTTEVEDVALACCNYQSTCIYEMVPLSNRQSKELFTAVLRSGEQYYSQLEEVPDEIVRRCAGLPQAIICISSVLASQGEANIVKNWEPIQNSFPRNTASTDILKQVLKFCYNCLPSILQTCLLYLSLYPENYLILKEDIMKQWVGEGFILAPACNEKMKVAGSYFDKLVNMGLIHHIDVDYPDEVLYYAVNHTVHDLITSKSIEENFVSAIDYSQRTVRFSNNISRLSLLFGSATYATTPPSVGLSQVRSLAFIGLKSCFPTISEFKVLRSLILHVWADQPSTGVDLKPTSDLALLRSLHVTCNGTVHLPDLKQGPENLETLEINAILAAIPANIVHLKNWLHLRLGVGTELPDLTSVLGNVTLNPPISLDESNSPANSVTTLELLSRISRIPKWTGQLINLCILKFVVTDLRRDDINRLQGLPFLSNLSLHVQQRTTELTSFAPGEFVTLEYFEFRCGVLHLKFQKGTMPRLQRLSLGFNARRGEQYGRRLEGIEHLLNVQEIYAIIGSVAGTQEDDLKAAKLAFKEAIGEDHCNVCIKRVDVIEEECGHTEKHQVIREKDLLTEQPAVLEQDSKKDMDQNASSSSQFIQRTMAPTRSFSSVGLFTFGSFSSVAAVAQLVGNACGLILSIRKAAETARQNKVDCDHLAFRVSTIGEVLSCLPPDVEVAQPLAELYKTLQEAHDLVVSCQNRSILNQLYTASCRTEKFMEVDARIVSDISVLNLRVVSYIDRRQNSGQTFPPNHTGVSTPKMASSPGSITGSSLSLQTHHDLPRILSWVEVATATNNLAFLLGGGRSGTVYKGRLLHCGRDLEVAVKVLKRQERLGVKDAFVAELEILYRLRHDYIARLVGWCTDGDRRVLIYERMSNGTLEDHLLRLHSSPPVSASWSTRVEVLLGASRAIEHLHSGAASQVIIHNNVSSSNILLDESWTPRLSGFGTAVLQENAAEGGSQLVIGALYDPEYRLTGYVSPASDVYSFGGVMLETLIGRPKMLETCRSLPLKLIQNDNLRDVLDGRQGLDPTTQQLEALELVAHTAWRCLRPRGKDRPTMSSVVAKLATAIGIMRRDEESKLLLPPSSNNRRNGPRYQDYSPGSPGPRSPGIARSRSASPTPRRRRRPLLEF